MFGQRQRRRHHVQCETKLTSSSSLDWNLSPPEEAIRLAKLKPDDCLLPVLANPTLRAIEGKVVLPPPSLWASLRGAEGKVDETCVVL